MYHFQFPCSFAVNVFPIDVCYSQATFPLEMLGLDNTSEDTWITQSEFLVKEHIDKQENDVL